MTAFVQKVAALAGVEEEQLERLAGGDLSEVLLVRRSDGRLSVAKGGPAIATETAMLRILARAGMPAPMVEAEHENVLLLEYIANDDCFTPSAWSDLGGALRRLHDQKGELHGWPVDYRLGSIELDNRESSDWPAFWGEQRLRKTAALLDHPWRERVDRLVTRLSDLVPASPAASLLHGDLWSGNILVSEGRLAALIDPACYPGHNEVDLAMLTLFGSPPAEFWDAYGSLEPGYSERRPIYQLFPALVHLRLFGASYATRTDALLNALGA
jgi:fructosamine-3-kinase